MPRESCRGCVAPPGLSGVSGPFPTAHGVGYDLPPSGLTTASRLSKTLLAHLLADDVG